MATREELMTALRNADAAGDVEAARRIAAMVPSQPSAPVPKNFGVETLEQTPMGEVGSWLKEHIPQPILEGISGASGSYRHIFGENRFPVHGDPESMSSIVGSLADPVSLALGGGAFSAATKAGSVAKAGRFLKNAIGGGAAGLASSAPQVVDEAVSGELGDAAKTAAIGGLGGGVLGAALFPLGWAADKALTGAKNIAGGASGRVGDWLRNEFDNLPAIRSSVEALRGFVPGEKPTVGLAAADARSSKLGALEQGARSRPYAAEQFSRIDQANRNARMRALQEQIEILSPAEQARKDIAGRLFSQADKEQIPVTPTLQQIMNGEMVSALRNKAGITGGQMETNASVAGRTFNPRSVPAQPEPSSNWSSPWQMDNVSPKPATMSVNELQLVKQAIDGELLAAQKGLPSPLGLSNVNQRQLAEARGQLISEGESLSPTWASARSTWADQSKPVNQRAVMSHLQQALNRPAAGEGAAQFNTAMKALPKTFEKATGMPRFSSPEEALGSLSPLGQRTVKGVEASLNREADVAKNWTAKQSSIRDMENPVDVIESSMPMMLNKAVSAARKGAQILGRSMDDKAQSLLDKAMTDPKEFLALIDAMPSSQRLPVLTKVNQMTSDPVVKGMIQSRISGQEK